MDDLIAFLRVRLDEFESADWHERSCQTHRAMPTGSPFGLAGAPMSCLCAVPEFVLADVAAKRQIIEAYLAERTLRDAYQAPAARAGEDEDQIVRRRSSAARCRGLEIAVEVLVLPYAGHPDYREEWRPATP